MLCSCTTTQVCFHRNYGTTATTKVWCDSYVTSAVWADTEWLKPKINLTWFHMFWPRPRLIVRVRECVRHARILRGQRRGSNFADRARHKRKKFLEAIK